MFVQRAGAVAAALVVLSGCGGDEPGATALPPASSAPSAVASSRVPSPVAVPSAAQAETPQGAAEFARFFYAEVERAYLELDPDIVARLSAPGCEACSKFVRTLTITKDKSERYEGVAYEIAVAEASAGDGPLTFVTIVYDAPPVVLYASDGSIIQRESGAQGVEEELELVRQAESWLVREVRAV